MPSYYGGITGTGTGAPDYGTAAGINQFMTGQAQAPYLANLPQYAQLTAQASGNILSNLKGEIPADVLAQMQQQAAERGVASGSPGSPNTNAAYLKAIGLTSLGLQQQGEASLTGAVNRTPVPQLFNPASLYVPERLGAQELAAAKAGMGAGRGGGGITYLGGGGGPAPQAPNPSPNYGGPQQAYGAIPGRFDQFDWQGNPTHPTDAAIQNIANGNLDDSWRIQDSPMGAPYGTPEGSWYNPQQDTYQSEPVYDDFSSYFE